MKYDQYSLKVTVTIGMCSSEGYYLLQDIIVEADKRLYSGKRNGKNRIVHSDKE